MNQQQTASVCSRALAQRTTTETEQIMATHGRTARMTMAAAAVGSVLALAACGGGEGSPIGGNDDGPATNADGDVVLEFAQWWEPELPDGALRELIDDFEAANPGIKVKLLSGPYASTKRAAGRRRRLGDDARRRRPRRRLGQRLRQAGRDRRPDRPDGRGRIRRQPARQPDPGRRHDLHDPRGQLRLPAVHQQRPARQGRRHQPRRAPAPSSPTPRKKSARSASDA